MSVLTWRMHYRMLEHALSTLSDLDPKTFQDKPTGFEAQEFPLILSDMSEALLALKQHCLNAERITPEMEADLIDLKRAKSALRG